MDMDCGPIDCLIITCFVLMHFIALRAPIHHKEVCKRRKGKSFIVTTAFHILRCLRLKREGTIASNYTLRKESKLTRLRHLKSGAFRILEESTHENVNNSEGSNTGVNKADSCLESNECGTNSSNNYRNGVCSKTE